MRCRILAACLAACLFPAGAALADRNDLTLENLIGRPSVPGMFNDPTDVGRQTLYKSLMSELGVVMAPHLLSPADTLGFYGFQLSFDARFTQITNSADYWQRGVESVSSSWLSTVSVLARKGVWMPLPSIEVGAGGTKLIASNLYALEAYVKVAIHEGYHSLPIQQAAIHVARQVLNDAWHSGLGMPHLAPVAGGAVHLEWDAGERALELLIGRDGAAEYLVLGEDGEATEEGMLLTGHLTGEHRLFDIFRGVSSQVGAAPNCSVNVQRDSRPEAQQA
jgi:hypothetical protein